MKVTENTAERFTITSRRSLFFDACLLFFVILGLLFAFAIATSEQGAIRSVLVVLCLCFAGVGLWGLWQNGSETVTFETRTQTAVIEWRNLKGTERLKFAFSELADIWVHEDDDMHTLQFKLTEGDPVLFERAYGANRRAYDVAKDARSWLQANGWRSAAT